jgi:hypothetical protein
MKVIEKAHLRASDRKTTLPAKMNAVKVGQEQIFDDKTGLFCVGTIIQTKMNRPLLQLTGFLSCQ